MGDIKTKKWNQLGVQKLQDVAMVKAELQKLHVLEGSARACLKRQFGNLQTTSQDTKEASGQLEDEELVRDALDKADGGGSDSESSGDNENGWVRDEAQTSSTAFSTAVHGFDEVNTDEEDSDDEPAAETLQGAVPRVSSSFFFEIFQCHS
jgi:hypothetical protein